MDCRTCSVRVRTEWCDLAGRDLALLDAAKTATEYDADEEIFRQGTPCSGLRYIASGMVATSRRWEGRAPVHVNVRYPGDTLGLRAWLCGGNHLATARALEPSRICLISGVALTHLLAKNSRALFCFLAKLASELDIAEERLFHRTVSTLERAWPGCSSRSRRHMDRPARERA
jgi:CRP-like cAMP-binding protein